MINVMAVLRTDFGGDVVQARLLEGIDNPPAISKLASESGVSEGRIGTSSSTIEFQRIAATKRRVLSFFSHVGMTFKRYSKQVGGFAWAGGNPSEAIDTSDYTKPPWQLLSVTNVPVAKMWVTTGQSIPDEVFSITGGTVARDGSYLYVIGEEESAYGVYDQPSE